MSEDSVVGAIVIKCINCLEKGMEGLLVPSAAVTLVLVAGVSAESPSRLEGNRGLGRCRGRGDEG